MITMDDKLAHTFGWYGKLPSRGDFVGRGMPRSWQRCWDEWLQRALADAANQLGAVVLRERLTSMTPWSCVVLPQQRHQPAWCGVVVASSDRVGRVFPLLLAEACDAGQLDRQPLAALQARASALARWLADARTLPPKDFEAGAASLVAADWMEAGNGGTTVNDRFESVRTGRPSASTFWWRAIPAFDMHAPLAEAWPPRDALLLDWIGEPD